MVILLYRQHRFKSKKNNYFEINFIKVLTFSTRGAKVLIVVSTQR